MDHALKHRQSLLASANTKQTVEQNVDAQIKRLADSLDAKRIAALSALGNRWVLSSSYDSRRCAHHSPSFKGSAVLTVFIAGRMAREMGRV